jgi:ABC-type lipoprotein export system ATPase subunit
LTVAYGSGEARVIALDGVDVSLVADEAVALWGPSGSGKTTLLHALGGLVEPTDGVVLWQGTPLSSLDTSARARARARGIGYVFQGSNLLPVFTAYENVAFAAYASGERDQVEERALEHLTLVGLREKADSLPSELSGGEAQRVAIARVLEMIGALQVRLGFTLVVATHDADVAAGLGRVIELRDGRVVPEER